MTKAKHSTVVGVFENREQAQKAVSELRRAGFREDEIGVIAQNREGTTGAGAREEDQGSHVGTGAATGAIAGAGVGALWALGIVTLGLPAVGPVIAGGILASILTSAAGTAVAGGIIGALIGLGIPEEEAHYYESEFKAGRTLVTVKTDTRHDEARSILQRYGAYDRSTAPAACASTTRTAEASAGQTMKLHEEKMHAHKQPVQTGEVKVRKETHTEHKTLEVPVEGEEVVVERHPASGHPVAGSELREGQEIRVPVTQEQVHIEKQPVVKEEISVGKHKVKDTETVSGTVRKEEAKVEHEGEAKMRDAGTGASCPPDSNRGKRS